MNILILNWRDPKNPNSGGAELLTQEIAKRWVKKGHTVFQISSAFQNSKSKETIDGVHFIRKGTWWSVQIFACYYYLRYLRNSVDVIIDEVHWFPFFSYLYAPKKTVLLACEVANQLFFRIFPYPVAVGWRLFEKCYLAFYKNVPTMVISQSTFQDLLKEGHNAFNMIVLPMGMTVPPKIKQYAKEKSPTLISVSRLNKQKGIVDIIEAFALIKKKISSVQLWLVGSADKDVLDQITDKINDYNIASSVTFFGFVTDEKKFELLSKAHLIISASVQEGWGLTIPEAGLTKTPAVVYNTQGFRDIIINKKDGILVNPHPTALAEGVITVFKNPDLYKKIQSAAQKKAKLYSWDKTAEISLNFLKSL